MSCCIFVSLSGRKRRGKRERWRCGGEEIQVASSQWQAATDNHCVCVCVCVLVLHRAFFSVCVFPRSSHLLRITRPKLFQGPFLTQPEAMLVQWQVAQYAVVWAVKHAYIYTLICKLAGRLSMHTHTQRHASFLTIPRATKHVFFFPLSAALSLAMVSTFDTLMCVTLTNRAEHIKRCGPDSAEIAD